jgi:hypothetical protein
MVSCRTFGSICCHDHPVADCLFVLVHTCCCVGPSNLKNIDGHYYQGLLLSSTIYFPSPVLCLVNSSSNSRLIFMVTFTFLYRFLSTCGARILVCIILVLCMQNTTTSSQHSLYIYMYIHYNLNLFDISSSSDMHCCCCTSSTNNYWKTNQ